jgi:hypothetical protein
MLEAAAAASGPDMGSGREWVRPWVAGIAGAGLAVAAAGPAAACRLALALAMDVSRSIDAADYEIQRGGLIAALADPAVRAAFLEHGPVALAVFEWSGEGYQEVVVDWLAVRRPDQLDRIAARLAQHARLPATLPTALGTALLFGRDLLASAPWCDARVLDVAGDGRNNDGRPPAWAHAQEGWDGITVNALAVGGHEAGLAEYFAREVIRGPGAFVEHAASQQDFPRAIRRKLLRELIPPLLGALPGQGFPSPRGAPIARP